MRTNTFWGTDWNHRLMAFAPLSNAHEAMSYLVWDRRAGLSAVLLLVFTVVVVWLVNHLHATANTAVKRISQPHPDQQWRLAP
ncbi:MAG: hypothetical protein KDD89_13520 [Anaerolineales bacterium]|nr:hypothetical protein [Anaerolineales bacterium]